MADAPPPLRRIRRHRSPVRKRPARLLPQREQWKEHRSPVSLLEPLAVGGSCDEWTKEKDDYARKIGVQWIVAVCAGHSQSRRDVCAGLAAKLQVSHATLALHCPWLLCPEDAWRPDPTATVLPTVVSPALVQDWPKRALSPPPDDGDEVFIDFLNDLVPLLPHDHVA